MLKRHDAGYDPLMPNPDIQATFFDLLRKMDREADTLRNGSPTGLSGYGSDARRNLKRSPTEPAWARRLTDLLNQAGWSARAGVPYPAPGKSRPRCDIVVTLPQRRRLWVEIVGAWKDSWLASGRPEVYRACLLHPLVPGLEKKSHTAPLAVEKLSFLTPEDAAVAGLLLLGFDSDECPMDSDVAELAGLSGLGRPPWEASSDRWKDPRRPGRNVKCWFWIRPVVKDLT